MLLKEDVAMRNLDLNSLWRSTGGFDRLFDLIDESARWTGEENHYPPYNIERTGEDNYQIALALAGFAPEEVSITAEQNVLIVEGRKAEKGEHQYLHGHATEDRAGEVEGETHHHQWQIAEPKQCAPASPHFGGANTARGRHLR
jgi:HSP20 family molecular chaperone IbpA